MNNKINKNLKLLKYYKHELSKQQYKTFKGQILSGNINGFKKGLFTTERDLAYAAYLYDGKGRRTCGRT